MFKKKGNAFWVLVNWQKQEIWDVIKVKLAFKHDTDLGEKVCSSPESYIGKVLEISWTESEGSSPAVFLGFGTSKDLESKRSLLVQKYYVSSGEEVADISKSNTVSGPSDLRNYKSNQQNALKEMIMNKNVPSPPSSSVTVPSTVGIPNEKYGHLKEKYRRVKNENKRLREENEKLKDGKSVLDELRELIYDIKRTKITSGQECSNNANSSSDEPGLVADDQKYELAPGVQVDKGQLSTMLRISPMEQNLLVRY